MVEKKLPLVTFMIYNLNHFSGLIVNLFYLPKFLFRARIFRRNLSIISLTKTGTSEKEMFNEEEDINREIKISMGGPWKRSYILKSLPNQNSPDRCWKKNYKGIIKRKVFFITWTAVPGSLNLRKIQFFLMKELEMEFSLKRFLVLFLNK